MNRKRWIWIVLGLAAALALFLSWNSFTVDPSFTPGSAEDSGGGAGESD